MIKVTMKDGRKAWINAAQIVSIRQESDELVQVYLSGGTLLTIRETNLDTFAGRIDAEIGHAFES